MSTYPRTAAALLTAIALSAAPASAQRRHEDGAGRAGGHDGVKRTQPDVPTAAPRANGAEQRQAQPRREPNVQERRAAADVSRRPDGPQVDTRVGGRDVGRAVPRYNARQTDRRVVPYRYVQPRVVVPVYRYRPYPRRSYVVPYGYRPYGYQPGWNQNLYFGRPYVGGYYTDRPYGYYSLAPGLVYGSLRIVDAPPSAQVYVDGYYAGVVDEYDGVFQHLNLEPGAHHIEIETGPGAEPIAFDVRVEPGQTVTFHARDYY